MNDKSFTAVLGVIVPEIVHGEGYDFPTYS